MKAGYYVGDRKYQVRDIQELIPGDNDVKIKVAWCGLCATDVHKFNGKNGASPVIPPIILGHECSGIVVQVGKAVTRFKPGDRVAADPSFHCGHCEFCQQGLVNFCKNRHGVAKGFAEYICPPEKNVYPIPDSLDLRTAAFAEPLSCIVHGLDLINIKSGSTVAIYGLGAIGSLLVQLVRYSGAAKIIVIEREPEKLRLAKHLGANIAVDDVEILNIYKDINIDYVIECIGNTKTMEQSCEIAGKNAKILWFGLGDPEQAVKINQYNAFTKELSIFTSYLNPYSTKRAIDILSSGILNTKDIISAELTLENIGDELDNLAFSRQGKVMLKLSGEL
ncbi:TPA: zinc-dependent alcohol dehydrogenase family protein [Raoultella planticola]|nr:zinc-dependent alcohol dehydrogenase family protein [Klebsiella variicola]